MTKAEFGRYPQDPEAYENGKRISVVDTLAENAANYGLQLCEKTQGGSLIPVALSIFHSLCCDADSPLDKSSLRS